MTFQEWMGKIEKATVKCNWSMYRIEIGLEEPEDKNIVKRCSAEIQRLVKIFLEENIKPLKELPRSLYFWVISATAAQETAKLELEINDARKNKVVSSSYTHNNQPVNLSIWRLFNKKNAKKRKVRKIVFHELLDNAYNFLSPILQDFHKLTREIYGRFGTTSSEAFVAFCELTLEQVYEINNRSGILAKPEFFWEAEKLWPEILGYPFEYSEYTDDLYLLRACVDKGLNQALQINPVESFNRVMCEMGFKAYFKNVAWDLEIRSGKHASPFCFTIDVPRNIKCSLMKSNPFGDLQGIFHEGGHAVHHASCNPDLPFWTRSMVPPTTVEIFSTIFEHLISNPAFLEEELGLDKKTIWVLRERIRLLELYFLSFYAAVSRLHLDLCHEILSIDEASRRFENYTGNYGIKLPGSYWLMHHVVGCYNFPYAPCYLLAEIRRADLQAKLEKEFGSRWYKSLDAGNYFKKEIFGQGDDVDLESFSNINSQRYFEGLGLV